MSSLYPVRSSGCFSVMLFHGRSAGDQGHAVFRFLSVPIPRSYHEQDESSKKRRGNSPPTTRSRDSRNVKTQAGTTGSKTGLVQQPPSGQGDLTETYAQIIPVRCIDTPIRPVVCAPATSGCATTMQMAFHKPGERIAPRGSRHIFST